MAKFRKLAALLACAVMASSVTGCTDTQYSAKIGDDEVKAGVYIAYLSNIMSNEITTLYYQGITEKPFDQQIDGVPLAQYVKDNSLKSLKEYCAITKQFDAEGLTITDDEMKQISSNLRTSWDSMGKLYEHEGVSKESLKELYLASLKKEKLFDHYYDKGGKEEASDDDLQKFVNENYLRYKIITFYTTSETDEAKKKEDQEAKQKQRDELFEKGSSLTFAEFDELIEEYNKMNQTAADNSSNADDSSSGADSSSASSESSSEASSDESKDDTSSDASSSDASSSDDSRASVDNSDSDSSSDDSSDAGSSSKEDSSSQSQNDSSEGDSSSEHDHEHDPYENEVVMNFKSYKDDTDSPSGKLYHFIKDLEVGKASKFENDYGYYIVIKGDIAERTDYVASNRDSVLHAAKDEAFQTMLDGWVSSANITINDKAIKRYTPEVIYDRMNEYYDKNKTANQ